MYTEGTRYIYVHVEGILGGEHRREEGHFVSRFRVELILWYTFSYVHVATHVCHAVHYSWFVYIYII